MDFESTVMHYLANEGLFLSPQFSVREGDKEWSCPDFLALDFRKPEVQVVEVTTASDVRVLIKKIEMREEQWFRRLRPQLVALGVPPSKGIPVDQWPIIARVFVRQDRHEHVRTKFPNPQDVRIEAIESIAIPWNWPWADWRKQLQSSDQPSDPSLS